MSACRHEKCSKEASPVQASESGAGLGSSLCGGEEDDVEVVTLKGWEYGSWWDWEGAQGAWKRQGVATS
eukprot:g28607.t1